jgi:8-oxo-dGTP pyrophosphatase MutT (NUDIX family)
MQAWKVRRSRIVLERPWLRVREEHVVLPTGHEIEEFHVIEGPDWVGVLALTEDNRVIVVDQYRHGLAAASRELPAGVIDAGESALDAARRELLEETGYSAENWQPLVSFSTEPTRHVTTAHFFVARGARRVAAQKLDASEDLTVTEISPGELFEQIQSGVIRHATHIAAVALAAVWGILQVSPRAHLDGQ